MVRRLPLIAQTPPPMRLALFYLGAAVAISIVFYAGAMLENLALVIVSVFAASFWMFSLVFVAVAFVLRARNKKREDLRP